jgi:tryptophan synthase alpha chain
MGVTGVQKNISDSLNEEVAVVKKMIHSPLAIGFGISNPEQAKKVAALGEAVVIGSALVNLIEKNLEDTARGNQELQGFARQITEAIKT